MPTYSKSYNSRDFDPAMPVVEIDLLAPVQNGVVSRLTALVDTGADASMLPIDVLQRVNARFIKTRQMRGVTGAAVGVDTYLVTLQLGNDEIPGIVAVAMSPGSEPIIGRDVLNQLQIRLNGPAQELWIE